LKTNSFENHKDLFGKQEGGSTPCTMIKYEGMSCMKLFFNRTLYTDVLRNRKGAAHHAS
jgi:hypothetical protein